MYSYKIKNKTALLYQDGQEAPFVSQPGYPSGESWTVDEATAWATLFVNAKNNPMSEELPGENKAKPVKYRSELPTLPEPDLTIAGLEQVPAENQSEEVENYEEKNIQAEEEVTTQAPKPAKKK